MYIDQVIRYTDGKEGSVHMLLCIIAHAVAIEMNSNKM